MEAESHSADIDIMKTETDFLAQVELAKIALRQFVKVLKDPDYATADNMKIGAMETLMKQTVCFLSNFLCPQLNKMS
jgi:hypothetical protein